jgi:DNA-binding transcriptional regulator YiaG
MLGAPGTSVPGARMPPTRRFIVAGLLAGATVFGTLSAVATPADAAAMQVASSIQRTLPAASPSTNSHVDIQSVSIRLQELRRRSGLNWGEIAYALSVSRRTIHNWLSGAQIAPGHLWRLLEFEALVDAVDNGDGGRTRESLTQSGSSGRTLLDEFALGSRPIRRVPLSTLSAGDLIAPDAADVSEAPTAQTPSRRSSVQGRPLPTRRPHAS